MSQEIVDDWAETPAYDGDESAQEHAEEETTPQTVYANVNEWVREYLRHAYRRRIDGRKLLWWHKWWQVDEALIRIESLWRAWEHLRLDPGTGMSVWWRDHADHHMPLLMSVEGPFAGIEGIDSPESTAKKQEPLPHEDAPKWMFTQEPLVPPE